MPRWLPWVLLVLLGAAFWLSGTAPFTSLPQHEEPAGATQVALPHTGAASSIPPSAPAPAPALPGFLPPEAAHTIALIQRDGPFPHQQDGGVFGNREGRLPRQPRGWYREYTVDTPGLSHRGARRIVTGGRPPTQWYYTDDHYDSFRRFEPAGSGQ